MATYHINKTRVRTRPWRGAYLFALTILAASIAGWPGALLVVAATVNVELR